jgi:hypothetical protein
MIVKAVIGGVLLVSSALAGDVNVRSFCDDFGVRLSLTVRMLSLQPGTTWTAKISNPKKLKAYGIAPTTVNDDLSVTYNGGASFTLKHAKSGKQATVRLGSMK